MRLYRRMLVRCGQQRFRRRLFFFVTWFLAESHDLAGASEVSSDGTVIVGSSAIGPLNSQTDGEAYRWTATTGMVGLGRLAPHHKHSAALDVSDDGSVIVGYSGTATFYPRAFRWTITDGMTDLGTFAPGSSYDYALARAVSGDGMVAVGYSRRANDDTEAFRWTDGTGLVGLGDLAGGKFFSDANDVSQDGSIVVGIGESASGREAFRWTSEDGMVGLGDLPGGTFFSEAHQISRDGSVIVGTSQSTLGVEAVRWSAIDGMVGLGDLPGGQYRSFAYDVSANGSVIVGRGTTTGGDVAFVWTPSAGMVDLRGLLVSHVVESANGWFLRAALAITEDGRTIVGYGDNPSGDWEPWVAVLPGPASTWNVDSSGNWSDVANWTPYVPNAAGAVAVFGEEISAARTVTADIPVTIGTIKFDNANSFTIGGTETITLDETSGEAEMNVTSGNHTISAPVALADDTVVTISPFDSSLVMTEPLNATSLNLTKDGAGTLVVGGFQIAELSILDGNVVLAPGSGVSVLSSLIIGYDETASVQAVPEPSAIVLTAIGAVLTCCALLRRRAR